MNDSPPSGSLSKLPLGSTITRKSTSIGTPTNGSIDLDIPVELVSEEEMAVIEAALAATCSSLSSSAAPAVTSPSAFRRNAESIQSITFLPKMELVSEEEMAVLDVALASACSSLSSSATPAVSSPSQFQGRSRSIRSITSLAKRRLSFGAEPDIEDSGNLWSTQKKRVAESFLHRFKSNSALSVSDITATVTKKVEVQGNSVEDGWAKKLMNFIIGANQLLSKGLTRELPLIGCAEGVWLVGMVDEVRMPVTEADRNPMLVDTKTRVQDTLPAEAQIRNGRLQLMCYKYLWDNLVAHKFPSKKFLDFFSLNPSYVLSKEIQQNTAESGFPAMTLDELLRYFERKCSMLPRAHNQLLVRYEFQKDNKVLGEHHFAYDSDWLKSQIHRSLEFWLGEREASCTPQEERWKCRFCQFAYVCPTNANPDRVPTLTKADLNSKPS